MKFILAAPSNAPNDWPLIQKAAVEAEELGFWGFVLPDHYMGGRQFGGDSTLDTWTALSYLAPLTDRIRLGSLVTPIGLRPPGVLAKIVSTLDFLTDGRSVRGVGAGSSQAEYEAYSHWDEPQTRVDRTGEGVELILRLWREGRVDFQGKFYKSKGAVLEPKPRQKPNPPIIFGGSGPRMLQMAGKYADICLVPLSESENRLAKEMVAKGAELRERLGDISFAGAAEALPQPWHNYTVTQYFEKAELAQKYGCEYFIVPFPWKTYFESMEDFAKNVMPSFLGRPLLGS